MMKEEVKVLVADNLGAHLSHRVMELCTEFNVRWVPNWPYCTVLYLPVPVMYSRYRYWYPPVPVPGIPNVFFTC